MKQLVLKKILTVLASALFAAAPAFADMLDFAVFAPRGASWSFTGHSPLSLSVPYGSVIANGLSLGSSSSETFTTGAFMGGGTETLNSRYYMFGRSGAGSYDITGCIAPGTAGCSEVTLFSGKFDDIELLWTATKGVMGFIGFGITGTVNSHLAAALGILPGTYSGIATFILTGSPAGSDAVMGGNLTLLSTGPTATPEPASLALLGIGLVAVAALKKYRT
jgi:hypothetical protein